MSMVASRDYYKDILIHKKVFLRSYKKNSAYFPSLEKFPIHAVFSWGKGLSNMSEKFEIPEKAHQKIKEFLIENEFTNPSLIVKITPDDNKMNTPFQGDKYDCYEVRTDIISQLTPSLPTPLVRVNANFIYTKDFFLTLSVFPADCPSAVIYAKGEGGKNLIGIAHWGRRQLSKMDPYFAIKRLVENEKIDPAFIHIAIMPGIGTEHYFIKQTDLAEDLPDYNRWGKRVEHKIIHGEGRFYLDLLGRTIDILRIAHIPKENIEAYNVDTYDAAKRGEAYSHRYATETGKIQNAGRMMLAAELF